MAMMTRKTDYFYKSDTYSFKTDMDEFRCIMTISACLHEVIKHTEAGWIGMNVFSRRLGIPGIFFPYHNIQYILVLLCMENIYEGDKLIQRGAIKIVQEEGAKKIMFNGEVGEALLKRRMENILNLSQKELATYESGGTHREKGNRRAFRAFATWKTTLDTEDSWVKYMQKLLYGR